MKIQLWKLEIKETVNENKDIYIVNMKKENLQFFLWKCLLQNMYKFGCNQLSECRF